MAALPVATEVVPHTPSAPRQAAAVILVKDGSRGPEVLLVKRSPNARFMADTWVFPGGALERETPPAGEERDDAHRAAAIRELREEAGVSLVGADDELVAFARWITPAALSIRFDAHFFLARLPRGQEVRVDGSECVDHLWVTPRAALEAADADELLLAFPTVKQLERLCSFDTVDELLADASGRSVEVVEPRVRMRDSAPEILLPGEAGYDES